MRLTDRSLMLAAAALSVVIAAIHVDDQGGVTVLTDPAWIGWGYRLLEVSALLIAGGLAYTAGAAAPGGRTRLAWAATLLVAVGPMAGYLLSRTVGLPGDPGDVGNWGDPLGTLSLIVEGVLAAIAGIGLVLSAPDRGLLRQSSAPVSA